MAHSNSQVNPRCVSRFRTFIPPQHHYWTWPQDLQGRDCFVLLGCRTSVDDLENLACHPHVVAASTSNRGAIFEVEIGFACLRTGIFREHPFHRGANQGVSNNAHFFFFFVFVTKQQWYGNLVFNTNQPITGKTASTARTELDLFEFSRCQLPLTAHIVGRGFRSASHLR